MTNIAALIVAAGRGSRYGGDGPKQYEMLAGRTLLRHAVLCQFDILHHKGIHVKHFTEACATL